MTPDIETELRLNAILANAISSQQIAILNTCLYLQKLDSERKFEIQKQNRINEDLDKRYKFEKEQFQKRRIK